MFGSDGVAMQRVMNGLTAAITHAACHKIAQRLEQEPSGRRLGEALLYTEPCAPQNRPSIRRWRRVSVPDFVDAGTDGARSRTDEASLDSEELRRRLAALQDERDDRQRRLDQALFRIDDLRKRLEDYAVLSGNLRTRLYQMEALRDAASESDADSVPADEAVPNDWDSLPDFAARRLAGHVVLANKAMRAAQSSHYPDVAFVYRVLLLLADCYAPMRWGTPGARELYQQRCAALRVDISPTGKATEARLTHEAYRVDHLGQRLICDLHVRGSSARDHTAFRLYFAWYEPKGERGYVIVGHLPTHLPNTHS
jgi:hypothetical protein